MCSILPAKAGYRTHITTGPKKWGQPKTAPNGDANLAFEVSNLAARPIVDVWIESLRVYQPGGEGGILAVTAHQRIDIIERSKTVQLQVDQQVANDFPVLEGIAVADGTFLGSDGISYSFEYSKVEGFSYEKRVIKNVRGDNGQTEFP